jgi:hypothetical protein
MSAMEPSLSNDSVVLQVLTCELIGLMNKPIITILTQVLCKMHSAYLALRFGHFEIAVIGQ